VKLHSVFCPVKKNKHNEDPLSICKNRYYLADVAVLEIVSSCAPDLLSSFRSVPPNITAYGMGQSKY